MKLLSNDAYINEGEDLILQINAEARAKMECGIDVINSSIGSLYDEEGRLAVPKTTSKYINELTILDENKTYPSCQGPREYREAVNSQKVSEYSIVSDIGDMICEEELESRIRGRSYRKVPQVPRWKASSVPVHLGGKPN